MECMAGLSAASAAATTTSAATATFAYNRKNFMYDREMRMRKEFKVQKFRVEQANLWRQDVRDLISLTEYKMHVYLLVNVLLLGFTVTLWCQGKLPESTPAWLMMGNALSICMAFIFILLSIWMAMHAAVAAQSFETRLLTQMVRLPIPTWQEIEACRTYASEFERIESAQMFRIPFAMGRQEGLVPASGEPPTNKRSAQDSKGTESDDKSRSSSSTAEDPGSHSDANIDPWGFERSGAEYAELGCKRGSAMIDLRHVKLARRAMIFWQGYDAFARICMSIGVDQLLLATTYFILAYYMEEVRVRSAATYGVIILTALAETLTRLDMSLVWWQARLLQLVVFTGPFMATAACYLRMYETRKREAEALVVLAFFSHAIYLIMINSLCRVQAEHNGTFLPLAFRSVLYLDVFGWAKRMTEDDIVHVSHRGPELKHFDADLSSQDSEENPVGFNAHEKHPSSKPATATVAYDDLGRPEPRGTQDVEVTNVEDYRCHPHAPDPDHYRNVRSGNHSIFFQAKSWLQEKDPHAHLNDSAIETGHEHEAPLILPWKIFTFVMNLACYAWLGAAVFHALDVASVWGYSPVALLRIEQPLDFLQVQPSWFEWFRSDLFGYDLNRAEGLMDKELVQLKWPHPNVEPHSLTCDSSGRTFVLSDGLSLFEAKLNSVTDNMMQHIALSANFDEVSSCTNLVGHAIQDVSVNCWTEQGRFSHQRENCEILALFGHGKRFATCFLGNQSTRSLEAGISDAWLEELRQSTLAGRPHGRIEKAVSLATDMGCKTSGEGSLLGCVLLGTTRGRVLRLANSTSGLLSPSQLLRERTAKDNTQWTSNSVRSISGRLIGALKPDGQKLQMIDKTFGKSVAELELKGQTTGFCSGGGFIYFLDAGPSPNMWRLPIPSSLLSHVGEQLPHQL
jgi:hypothetical protein